VKISVILPTNKKNSQEELDKFHKIESICGKHSNVLNDEFAYLVIAMIPESTHTLEPTLDSLYTQTFEPDEFEVLLCHKYPDDVKGIEKRYKDFNLRIIKEKPSIWHELGDEYRTVNNIRNGGILEAQGELLLFLDDYTIFNHDLLEKAWNAYQNGYYITARGMRRIRYNPDAKSTETPTRKSIVDKGIYSSYNFNHTKEGDIIPNSATWTYCCSVSLEETLYINAFDEIWDGNFGGTDQDFGRRLARITKYKRKLMGTIYEFAHSSPRHKTRNDEILRQICGQMIPKHIRANEWKPTEAEMRRYKKWHESNIGYLDQNWNKFLKVPMCNLEEMKK